MRFRIILAAAAAPAALAATLLGTAAQPAHAWAWDPHVTVTGKIVGCGASGPIQVESVRANLNGEIRTWGPVTTSSQPTYSVSFDNVPNGGGYAWVVVNCSVMPNYGTWIHVTRHGWGNTESGVNI